MPGNCLILWVFINSFYLAEGQSCAAGLMFERPQGALFLACLTLLTVLSQ